ncbi:hypothetical protein BH10PAT1_BH10PAT1_3000 [soil metagenome]
MKFYIVFVMLFVIVGVLLLFNHWGATIRFTSWIFYLLTIIVVWRFFEKN